MAEPGPAAFMSYARFDDRHDGGRLTEFRERLSGEVQAHTGEEFEIFQDVEGIKWGQDWKDRIDESLGQVTFLIPILTPSFFNSEACRGELEGFLEREREQDRNDLVLPLYYIDHPPFNDEDQRAGDELAATIASHNWADWRDLRYEPSTSPEVFKRLAQLAVQIRDALARANAPVKTRRRPASRTKSSRAATSAERPAGDPPTSTNESAGSESTGAEVATTSRGPSARSEPPTRVVDQMGRGDHATITEAIQAANPGDRIVVRRGLYREGLVIDKPLEIVGEGDVSEVEVEAEGADALLIIADMARVSNLTLRQIGGGNWFGIDIAQGRGEIEGCDITSQALSCVAIHGGADPRLRRNRIHDGNQSGVFVYDNGRGMLEDNDIFGNASSGVAIEEGGNPTLRGNRVHDGKGTGIFVHSKGRGTLEDNDIFGNAKAGVSIRDGGDPTLRRNRISRNGYEAIWVYDAGGGTFEDNDLRDNDRGAWDISSDSKANVKRSRNKAK